MTGETFVTGHLPEGSVSSWIARFHELVEDRGEVLDLACGSGRHGRLFLAKGHPVVFVDQKIDSVRDLSAQKGASLLETDLEDGSDWPFEEGRFAAIIVTNYLYRAHLENLMRSLKPRGVLLYETFALGNERFGKPRSPDFLLKSGELLDLVHGRLQVVAYEHGIWDNDTIPRVIQRICCVNDLNLSLREDGEPATHRLHGKS
jgi:SAM-dependent methyltransferase